MDGHTNITALLHKLPVNTQKIVRLVGNVIMVCVFLRIMPIVLDYIAKNGKFLTSITRVPFKYLYWSLPVGAALTIVQLILKSALLFEKKDEPKTV